MTSRIDPRVESAQSEAAARIDAEVAAVPLRDWLTRGWTLLFFPLELGEGWRLSLSPQELAIGAIEAEPGVLRLPVRLLARPLISARPVSLRSRALPPPGAPPRNEGFGVDVEAAWAHEALGPLLGRALSGRRIPVGGAAVEVVGVEAQPNHEGIALGLDLVGWRVGRIWLVSKPRFDGGRVHFVEARLTRESRDALGAGAADALERALGAALVEHGGIDPSERLASARESVARFARELPLPDGAEVELALEAPPGGGQLFWDERRLYLRVLMPGRFRVVIDALGLAQWQPDAS